MTTSRASEPVDLLLERRLELGLPASPAPLQPARQLLIRGSALGLLLGLISLAAMVWMQRQEAALQEQIATLEPVEVRVQGAGRRLKSLRTSTKTLITETKRITAQLVSVRSGSAFLEQLRRVTPDGVQLVSVSVQPSLIAINGQALGSPTVGSFERINALALNLEALPEVPFEGATIEKASTDANGLTEFRLSVAFDGSVRTSPAELRALGADGLARRYEYLREQGLDL